MRGSLFDLVLLSVIILFFGLSQRVRSQRYFRLWLAGWLFILFSIAVWITVPLNPIWHTVLDCLHYDALACGGIAFVLSSLPTREQWQKSVLPGLALSTPACIVIDIVVTHSANSWLLCALILIGQAVAALVAVRYLWKEGGWKGSQWSYRIIVYICFVTAIWQVGHVQAVVADGLCAAIFAQIFLCAGILFFTLRHNGVVAKWTGTVGFVAWSMSYPLYAARGQFPSLLPISSQLWNLPMYLVGFGMILKVIEEKTADMAELSEEYRLLYEDNPHPMWISDPSSGAFLSVNDSAIKAYGYSRDEFLAMTYSDIHVIEEGPHPIEHLSSKHNEAKQVQKHRRKNGDTFYVDVTGHDASFRGVKARFKLAVDITEREQLNRELAYRAQHDVLTELPNRMLLEDRIQQSLQHATRERRKVALLTIDVDRFKQINDTYGHLIGDECLKAIADRMRSCVRKVDTVARTGGEEFTIIATGLTSSDGAKKIACTLLSLFDELLVLPEHEIKTSVSIGVAIYPDDGDSSYTIRKRSDNALYSAKRMGGNCIIFASDEVVPLIESTPEIELALRQSLAVGDLHLLYQPIYDAQGFPCSVEALLKVKNTQLQQIGIPNLISIAEESGLIVPIGAWILDEVCRQMEDLAKQEVNHIRFAVNVSCRQLLQKGFSEMVLETLQRHAIPPDRIDLEITETTVMKDYGRIVQEMTALSRAGVRFSIDDFGTGYSSLERLSELPISILKIDRAFVSKLFHGSGAFTIVSATIQLARNLHIEVVAEGVETSEQLAILRELGCDMFQGYLLSKPQETNAVLSMLLNGHDNYISHPEFTASVVLGRGGPPPILYQSVVAQT